MAKLSTGTRRRSGSGGNSNPALRRLIDRVLHDADDRKTPRIVSPGAEAPGPAGFPSVPVQILEDDTAYRLTADLEGLEKDDIEVISNDGIVTIIGQRTLRRSEGDQVSDRSETCIEQFEHSFDLPDGIDLAGITAELLNGILTVTLPKSPTRRRRPAI